MTHRLPLILAIAALAVYGGTAVVGAATVKRAPDAARAAAVNQRPAARHDRYCIAEAAQAGRTQSAASCYPTFAASVLAATSGRVHLPVSARPGSVIGDRLNSGRGRHATYVLSIDFQNNDFGGNSLIWYQRSRCGYFQTASMPSGWNDVISSVIAESRCSTTLFWNNNFGSPTYPIARNGSAASLGVFNDETSSQTWCPHSPCGR